MIRRAPASCLILLSLLLEALSACQPTKVPTAFSLQVTVHTEANAPVPAATILLDGVAAGVTDGTGELQFTSPAPEGQVLTLQVECPVGYDSTHESVPVAVRRLAPLAGSDTPPALRQRLICNGTEQTSVVVVNTGEPNLPVVVNDTVQATTNESGIAHVALRGKAETAFTIKIDTTTHPELHPQNASRTFTLGNAGALLSFEQSFKREKARKPRSRIKNAPSAPYRME